MTGRILILTMSLLSVAGLARAELNGTRGSNAGLGAGAAAGALVGGPPGALLGAGLGAYFGDRIERAVAADRMEGELTQSRRDAEDLRESLASALAEIDDRETIIADLERRQTLARNLELEVLFLTDSSELDETATRRLDRLAGLLRANPSLGVRLDGHADARGTAEHNTRLSAARTESVRAALLAQGVGGERIGAFHHGEDAARAPTDDLDAHALDRRVVIRLVTGRAAARIASSEAEATGITH